MAELIPINVQRIEYLRDLFFGHAKRGQQDFLRRINVGLKTPLVEGQVFSENIPLTHLKRVDKIFKKGISFYTNPQNLTVDPNTCIFFSQRSLQFSSRLWRSRKIARDRKQNRFNSCYVYPYKLYHHQEITSVFP